MGSNGQSFLTAVTKKCNEAECTFFSQINTILAVNVVFVPKSLFVPKLSTQSNKNVEVPSNDICQIIKCTWNFCANIIKMSTSVWPA